MTPTLTFSGVDFFLVLGGGLLLLIALRITAYLLDLAPLRAATKTSLRRFTPLVALIICLAYLLWSVQALFGPHTTLLPVMLALVLVACVSAIWGPIRDLLAGVFLRAGGMIRLGDELQVGDMSGHVEGFGARRVVLRSAKGEALVPYGELSKATIVRTQGGHGTAAHTFRVRPIAGLSQADLRRLVSESALLCHWTSPARPPKLVNAEQGALDVTVFAVAKEYGVEIEGVVRTQLAIIEQPESPEALAQMTQVAIPREDVAAPKDVAE